jgi:hypothetical protein
MSRESALANLQEDFAAAFLGGDPGRALAHLAGDPATARSRFGIYRNAIAANWHGALLAAYPVVARMVGDACFAEAARQYAQAQPPDSGDMNRYGSSFARFLDAFPPEASAPWLPDVARLEWSWHESLLAADAPALDFERLQGIPEDEEPRLVFTLHPSVRLVRSPWPVISIWEANQPDRDGKPDRDAGADDVLVWREANRVRMTRLAKTEAGMLERLAGGSALEDVPGTGDEDAFPPLLRRLAGHGMLAGFAILPAETG